MRMRWPWQTAVDEALEALDRAIEEATRTTREADWIHRHVRQEGSNDDDQ